MAVQPGLCRTWSETPKTGFLTTRLKCQKLISVVIYNRIFQDERTKERPGHYENTPMQYTVTFHSCKNVHFQMKFFDYFHIFLKTLIVSFHFEIQHTAIFHGCRNYNFQSIFFYYFHIFAQNIDCGYTEADLTSYHDLVFRAKIRK